MNTRELRQLLEDVEDTREIVLADRAAIADRRGVAELQTVWSAARAEANLAYDAWRTAGGDDAYAAYHAAEDRADAAEDALAAACLQPGHRTPVRNLPAALTPRPGEPTA
jgi:hypothetical protein